MKKLLFALTIIFFLNQKSFSQNVGCNDLADYIVQNGVLHASLGNYTLNSSWLYEVKAYMYDYKIFVIAKIKKSEYDYRTSSYIFCSIPSQNWINFEYGGPGDSESYGERFHQYIMNYTCNCN
jgi:hypothetical protein